MVSLLHLRRTHPFRLITPYFPLKRGWGMQASCCPAVSCRYHSPDFYRKVKQILVWAVKQYICYQIFTAIDNCGQETAWARFDHLSPERE
jgi:hypothetical protein